ncbi:TetR/AcrR family transcriptional regulator C-terminal domain-containing protein [Lederbergia sp. NSJ-179]|uniref:TetR/AcrR family transcriptional regulator n=1 Tax=Lederbergia sp. NSJ-179 TaxID=2931402 RepID=UPI001FD1E198|nr:TetR family transcriptional regulator [Lederbergia sp. NSJ-179]MCJ7843179.1 TetR/AcrR family transcriptional regulator C-terminal domain-containing protein [Lederbergia sp. NSJ-179]
MSHRKGTLTEEKIIEATWKVLGEVGIEKFGMRKLADELHIKAASLYWHFQSKQSIFQTLTNEVAKDTLLNLERKEKWDDQLLEIGKAFRNSLQKYPCSAKVIMKSLPNELQYLKLLNIILETIDFMPITDEQKLANVMCLLNYIISYEDDAYEQKQNEETLKEGEYVYDLFDKAVQQLPDEDSYFIKKIYKASRQKMQSDKIFEYGLTIIIDGMKARLTV